MVKNENNNRKETKQNEPNAERRMLYYNNVNVFTYIMYIPVFV